MGFWEELAEMKRKADGYDRILRTVQSYRGPSAELGSVIGDLLVFREIQNNPANNEIIYAAIAECDKRTLNQ